MGDRHNKSKTLNNIGAIYLKQNDYAKAQSYFEQTLSISREIGDRWMLMTALLNLGAIASGQGEYDKARSCYEEIFRLQRATGRKQGSGAALNNLGCIYIKLGDYTQAKTCLEQALHINRELAQQDGEGESLVNLALHYYQTGDFQTAKVHCLEALEIGQKLNLHTIHADALTLLGHILVGLEAGEQAAQAYTQALALRRKSDEYHLATEALAGLARVALVRNDPDQALAYTEEILGYLESHTLPDTPGRFGIYLTCYQVLRTNDDSRAQEILTTAHSLLQEPAAKISDKAMRRSFLENVAVNRQILHTYSN